MRFLQIATSRSVGLVCAVGLALWVGPASADTASFSYPLLATSSAGGGTIISVGGISLPSTGTSGFNLNFSLPRDYLSDGKVKIAMLVRGAAPPCTIKFEASSLARRRAGRLPLSGSAGLTAANGSPTVFFANQKVVAKVFSLVPDPAFPGQRGGDAFYATFHREAGDAADNCSSNLVVDSIEVVYPRP